METSLIKNCDTVAVRKEFFNVEDVDKFFVWVRQINENFSFNIDKIGLGREDVQGMVKQLNGLPEPETLGAIARIINIYSEAAKHNMAIAVISIGDD